MKDYIECKPVMLPTTDISAPIWKGHRSGTLKPTRGTLSGTHHLHLVSEQEIKAGPYINLADLPDGVRYMDTEGNMWSSTTKSIIATTDKSLSLPLIPSSFIERWVNEQGKIDKVRLDVELDDFREEYTDIPQLDNNEVIILPIEDKTYSREDMEKAWEDGYEIGANLDMEPRQFNDWLDKNYPI